MFFIQRLLPMSMTLWSFSYMTADMRIGVECWKYKRGWMGVYVCWLIVGLRIGLIERQDGWINFSRLWLVLNPVDDGTIDGVSFFLFYFEVFLFLAGSYWLIFQHFGWFWQFGFGWTEIGILKFYYIPKNYFNWLLSEAPWTIIAQQISPLEPIFFWRFFCSQARFCY